MAMASHDLGDAALIYANQGGNLMLKKPARFHQIFDVRSHFRRDVRGRCTVHCISLSGKMRRNRVDIYVVEDQILRAFSKYQPRFHRGYSAQNR